jgi:hypothetical protein
MFEPDNFFDRDIARSTANCVGTRGGVVGRSAVGVRTDMLGDCVWC